MRESIALLYHPVQLLGTGGTGVMSALVVIRKLDPRPKKKQCQPLMNSKHVRLAPGKYQIAQDLGKARQEYEDGPM